MDKEQYMALLSEIIKKQAVILGPDIAILKARGVMELSVDESGKVTDIKGDSDAALQKLVDQYVALSGQIVKTALSSVFTKYPSLKQRVE